MGVRYLMLVRVLREELGFRAIERTAPLRTEFVVRVHHRSVVMTMRAVLQHHVQLGAKAQPQYEARSRYTVHRPHRL